MLTEQKYIFISVVIPVYNTLDSLVPLRDRLDSVLTSKIPSFQKMESFDPETAYEIIFVDDASTNPKTWLTLSELKTKYDNIKILKLGNNFGQHAAILAGMKQSSGKYIITMDDDLQHPPEEIPKLLQKGNYDVVIAKFKTETISQRFHLFKRWNLYILKNKLGGGLKRFIEINFFHRPKDIYISTFILFKREVVDKMLEIEGPKPLLSSYIFHTTKNIVNVEVEHNERREGQSGYTFRKQARLFSYMFYNYFRLRRLKNHKKM